MMRIKNNIILFLLTLSLNGCISSKSLVSFEILQPAVFTYPEYVDTIGYLNRSARTFDTYTGINKDSLDDTDLYLIDKIYSKSIIEGIEEGKANSPLAYMDELKYIEARGSDTLYRNVPIPSEDVNKICSRFGLDALISQDSYELEFQKFYHYNYQGIRMEQIIAFRQNIMWTIYIPGMEDPLDNWQFNDTLYFSNRAGIPDSLRKHSPLSVMKDGAREAGYSFGARNVPVWSEVSRIVYTGYHKELRQAKEHTDKGHWEEAKEIWEKNIISEKKILSEKCALNLAVYHELNDDVDSALYYANQARGSYYLPEIELYIQELNIRKQNRIDLNKQLRIDD